MKSPIRSFRLAATDALLTNRNAARTLTNVASRSSILLETDRSRFTAREYVSFKRQQQTTVINIMTPTPTKNEAESAMAVNVDQLDTIKNPNVRRVALEAQALREDLKRDPKVKLYGTYSEAYSGEQA